MIHVAGMALIVDSIDDAFQYAASGLDLSQQQCAGVAGENAAVESRLESFAGYACHGNRSMFILRFQGGFPPGVIVDRLSA